MKRRRLWAVSMEFCPGILGWEERKTALSTNPGLCQEDPVRIARIWDELFHWTNQTNNCRNPRGFVLP